MSRLKVFTVVLATVVLAGCIDSEVALQVASDGHGRAVITTRIYESSRRAFDESIPIGGPPEEKKATPLEEELPPPSEPELAGLFGIPIKIVSSDVTKAPDGGIRKTTVEFADISKMRMMFPPLIMAAGLHGTVGVGGVDDRPLLTFAFRLHENGNRLLLVRLPDVKMNANGDAPAPSDEGALKQGSREEQILKRAIRHAALRLTVALEDTTLLRSNAPAVDGNTATILDIRFDKLIDSMDDDTLRRATLIGSLQDLIWQLRTQPGVAAPVDPEVFLEFEPSQQQIAAAPATPPQAQAPPDTEIYLAPLTRTEGKLTVGPPVNITQNPGYDNQPYFTPDGTSMLFASVRGGARQTDIYRYDLASKKISQVTNTPEAEYSPTPTPDGGISVVRVEADGTQRLWRFDADGTHPRVILESVKPVGYHAWSDDHTLALFVLGGQGQPSTLQVADTKTGVAKVVATDIGRSLQTIPGTPHVSFVQRSRADERTTLTVKELDPQTGAITDLTPAVRGTTEADCAWTPDGTLIMAAGDRLYTWRRGERDWSVLQGSERLGLKGMTRLRVDPKGAWIALVAAP